MFDRIVLPAEKRPGLDMEAGAGAIGRSSRRRGRETELRQGGTAAGGLGFIRVHGREDGELADAAVDRRPFRLEQRKLLLAGPTAGRRQN
jgi:hypothetical protein